MDLPCNPGVLIADLGCPCCSQHLKGPVGEVGPESPMKMRAKKGWGPTLQWNCALLWRAELAFMVAL